MDDRMTQPEDVARSIIEDSLYMVLATADATGRPWSSPVYFANDGYTRFYWVSSPDVTHSRNIATRPEVGIAIFDSRAPISTGQAVYLRATAAEVTGADIDRGIEVFSRRSLSHGGVAWSPADVQGPDMRLYRAVVDEHSILAKDGRPDHRVPVRLT
jgi:nitroimidazol reductase NimA-like FMN-containing flavoprotein (pyridoxamine 5'-phosphate oxidase superfamily)